MAITRRHFALTCAAALHNSIAGSQGSVRLLRVPQGGIQPQAATGDRGTLHLIYFAGDPKNGDIFYVTSRDGGASFSQPLRVNSQPGSAIALGTIRGAQVALGRRGRIHVAWNGSQMAEPKGPMNPDYHQSGSPMLYTRLNDD